MLCLRISSYQISSEKGLWCWGGVCGALQAKPGFSWGRGSGSTLQRGTGERQLAKDSRLLSRTLCRALLSHRWERAASFQICVLKLNFLLFNNTNIHYSCNFPFYINLCCAKSLQSCPTLRSPVDCSLPGPPFHELLQARILEWVAMPFSRGSSLSRGSSQSRDRTRVSCIAGRFFTTREVT